MLRAACAGVAQRISRPSLSSSPRERETAQHRFSFGSTSRHEEAKGGSLWTSTATARLDSLSFALPCRLCSGRWPCLRLRPAPRSERRNSGPRARMRHGGYAAITFRTRIKSPPAWCAISIPSVPVVGPCSAAPPSDERGENDERPRLLRCGNAVVIGRFRSGGRHSASRHAHHEKLTGGNRYPDGNTHPPSSRPRADPARANQPALPPHRHRVGRAHDCVPAPPAER